MEPISLIVGALVMGATAAAKDLGGQTLKDAYAGLKKLITDHFQRAAAVAALEEDVSSETQKKALQETLARSNAAKDPAILQETLAKAKELVQALDNVPRPEREHALGAYIGDLDTINATFRDIDVEGGLGVWIQKVKAKDFTLAGVKVRGSG